MHAAAGQRDHQRVFGGVDVPDPGHDLALHGHLRLWHLLHRGDSSSLRGIASRPGHRVQNHLGDAAADGALLPHLLPHQQTAGPHSQPGDLQLLHQRETAGDAARHRPVPRSGERGAEHHPGRAGAAHQDGGGRPDAAERLLHAGVGRGAGLQHHVRDHGERVHQDTGVRERQVQHIGHPVCQGLGLRGPGRLHSAENHNAVLQTPAALRLQRHQAGRDAGGV